MPKKRKDKVTVRLNLTGELMRKFLELKGWYGATSYRNLCHMLITEKYEQMKNQKPLSS